MPDVRSGLDPADYRFINPNPDPDFSPERNKAVVEETIKEATTYHRALWFARDKDLENRIDILATFGDYKLNRNGSKDIEKYLGKEQYKAIIGENILSKLRIAEASNKLQGKKTKGILI